MPRAKSYYFGLSPMEDLPLYVEGFVNAMDVSYPDFDSLLGLKHGAVRVTSSVVNDNARIMVRAVPNTDILIAIDGRTGKFDVSGEAKGFKLDRTFPWRPASAGLHGGVLSDIKSYIEDTLPSKVKYVVYPDQGGKFEFDSAADLTRRFPAEGTTPTGGSRRRELQGQPVLKGLVGPVWDGRDGDVVRVRYDGPEGFRALTTASVGGSLEQGMARLAAQNAELRPYLLRLAYYGFHMPTMPRDFHLPTKLKNTPPEVPEGTDLAVWTWEEDKNGRTVYYGIMFQGKANKPLWHYSFRDPGSRQRMIDESAKSRRLSLESKKQRMEERKNFKHGLEVGTVLYASWGYDQTNIDFYEVVEVKDKAVVIRKIQSKVHHEERGADYVVAAPGKFAGPPMTKMPQGSGTHVYVKISDYAHAYVWDGKPKYETAAGWGH